MRVFFQRRTMIDAQSGKRTWNRQVGMPTKIVEKVEKPIAWTVGRAASGVSSCTRDAGAGREAAGDTPISLLKLARPPLGRQSDHMMRTRIQPWGSMKGLRASQAWAHLNDEWPCDCMLGRTRSMAMSFSCGDRKRADCGCR